MNKEKAKRLLNERMVKLDEPNFNPVIWTDETNRLLKQIFPKEIVEDMINSINDIDYEPDVMYPSTDLVIKYMQQGKNEAKQYIQGFIDDITNHGVINVNVNDGNVNHIEKKCLISDGTFWGIILVIMGGLFAGGFYFGNNKYDDGKNKLYEEKQQLKQQNDSLRKIIMLKDTI